MENRFVPVADNQELEQLIARSHDAPVLLFKHSSTCPISATAYKEMTKLTREIALVVVQRSRDVSREIEARTGVRHESPQALVLRHGEAVWSASHWNVTADAVERALEEHK
ncbi:MAG TPA: bacillithiol system redox-active protein YtxJ [Pyrinomonadaceae bacterium]|nr:bacillithiol system redox-active protein YtxJ [Pyrinomonadaceae bacterium]